MLLKVYIYKKMYIEFNSNRKWIPPEKNRIQTGFELSWHGKRALLLCKNLNEAGKVAVTARNQNLQDGNYYCLSLPYKAYLLDFYRFR